MKKKLFILNICMVALGLTGCNVPTEKRSDYSNSSQVPKFVTEKNFLDVCNGSKVAGAADYDKTAGTNSPIFVFYQGQAEQSFRNDYYNFPDDWKADYSNLAKTQLVACITVSERKEKKRCNYPQGGKTYVLIMNDAKFKTKVFEAKTGNLVAEKDFDLKAAQDCPISAAFTGPESTQDPDYKQLILNFLKPMVKH